MKVSVIIPTYNRPEQLALELSCLAVQEGGHVEEVLVCDDGSSTDTTAVLESFETRIPGLRLLRQEDRGFRAGQARNMGIREARGELLLFIDDDLLLPVGFVDAHVRSHDGSRRAVLGYRFRTGSLPTGIPPAIGDVLVFGPDDRESRLGPEGQGLAGHQYPWFFVYSCNFSVVNDPKSVRFDEEFVGWGMEDLELGYRLCRSGFEVILERKASALHIESPRPRDPFVCEERGLSPTYDSYVRNMVQFMDKYPEDPRLREVLITDLRWFVRDQEGRHWIKNGFENDASAVIEAVRLERRGGAGPAVPGEGSGRDSVPSGVGNA